MAAGISVLHVDDEPDFAEMAATFLEQEDDRIQVQTATTPDDGLDTLADHEIDCIVSDYDMPGTNGIEFLEAVRQDYPDLPFILYTGKGSEEIASEAISIGVTDYLQKDHGTDQYTILANRITNAVAKARAEQEVEQTREHFGRILEHASDYVMIVDGNGQVQYISPAVERVLGYTADELEAVDAFEHVHPDDLAVASEGFGAVLEQPDQEHTVEYRARHADGSWRWLEVRGRNRLKDPVIQGVIVSVRDITERKTREQELKQKERRYQAVFNDPNVLVGILDADGTVLNANRTALEYIHATPEEVTGDPLWETPWFDHSEAIQRRVKDWLDRAASGEYVEFEIGLPSPDGERYTVQGVVRPVTTHEGEIVSLLISGRDITARKEQERELKDKSNLLDQLFEQVPTHLYVMDEEARLLRVSEHFVDNPEDRIGKTDREIAPGEFGEETHADNMAVIETGEPLINKEEYLDERDKWGLTSKVPWYDETGEIAGLIGVTRDITERKEYEEELERKNEQLDEFASVVSHDLRNPMRVADGRLDLAQEVCESDHLDAIETALGRMDRIIEDVLWLAREGRDIGSVAPVTLATVIEDTWTLVSEDTDQAAIQYADEGLTASTILADENRFRHLLENLLRNAIEHGGADVTVTVGILEDGLYVEDDGPGIPVEEREEIFDAGYSTSEEGTGFGLRIVKQVVEGHGWEIQAIEGSGGGARFEITGVEFAEDE